LQYVNLTFFNKCITVLLNLYYSPEEDALILEEAAKSGANAGTWKRLRQLLNRQLTTTITYRHKLLTSATDRGTWTLQEDEDLLKHFFDGKTETTIQDIREISLQDLKGVRNKVNR
jgi:hypothetical protein